MQETITLVTVVLIAVIGLIYFVAKDKREEKQKEGSTI